MIDAIVKGLVACILGVGMVFIPLVIGFALLAISFDGQKWECNNETPSYINITELCGEEE